jgi:hypothetical protein
VTSLSGPSTRSPNAGMAGGWEVLFHLRNRGSLHTIAGRAKTERTPSEAQSPLRSREENRLVRDSHSRVREKARRPKEKSMDDGILVLEWWRPGGTDLA